MWLETEAKLLPAMQGCMPCVNGSEMWWSIVVTSNIQCEVYMARTMCETSVTCDSSDSSVCYNKIESD